MSRASRILFTLAVSLSVVAGCQGPLATKPADDEGRLSNARNGRATVKVGSRTLTLRTRDGRSIGNVSVLIGGKVYTAKDGKLDLPDSVLKAAEAQGGLVVLVAGQVPLRVSLGTSQEIVLTPTGATHTTRGLSPAGGEVRSRDGAATAVIPPGMLQNPRTDVSMSPYVPGGGSGTASGSPSTGNGGGTTGTGSGTTGPGSGTGGGATGGGSSGTSGTTNGGNGGSDPAADREKFIRDVASPGGGQACDQPVPCLPLIGGIGYLMRVGGPLRAGEVSVTIDLATAMNGWNGAAPYPWDADPAAWPDVARAHALAADRILDTFAAFDRSGEPGWRRVLADQHGIRLEDTRLTYRFQVGDDAVTAGHAILEIEGVTLLGTRLEVTLVSAVGGDLPDEADDGERPQGPPGTTATTAPGTNPGQGPAEYQPIPTNPVDPSGNPILLSLGDDIVLTTPLLGNTTNTFLGNTTNTLLGNVGGDTLVNQGAPLLGNTTNTLLGNTTNTLLGNTTNTLLGNTTNTLLGNTTNTLLANNQGGSIRGEVRVPFEPPAGPGAKYRLKAYTDYPWPGASVRAIIGFGNPYTGWATTDGASRYVIDSMRYSMNGVFIQVAAGPYTLYSLAPAPRAGVVEANVDAATTALSCLLLTEIARDPLAAIAVKRSGFESDVVALRALMSQTDAGIVVSNPVPAVAAYVRTLAQSNGLVLKCLPTVQSLAGSGTQGYQDGIASAAQFNGPTGLAVDNAGTIYVADHDNRAIRRIDSAGNVTTIAGAPPPTSIIGFLDGLGLAARFEGPFEVATFGGKLFVADANAQRIRQIDGAGNVSTIAGTGVSVPSLDGPGLSATLAEPFDVVADGTGNLYVAERTGDTIRKLTPNGAGGFTVSTVAGARAMPGYVDGPAATARFNSPRGLALDAAGNLYVSEWNNHVIRRIALGKPPTAPDFVTTFAGSSSSGGNDGVGTVASFDYPLGLAMDVGGNLFVAENQGFRIRRITPSGVVTTFAGIGPSATVFINGLASRAALRGPHGLAVDSTGALLFVETGYDRVRRITW